MSYIVVVNPSILASPGTGMVFSGVLTATVLVAFSMTLLMGLYARLPFAVAPGMGLNAFFAYTIIIRDGVPWQTALGIVFWAGVLFLLVSTTRLREHIATSIPAGLRLSAAAGIGLLLTFIGLRNAGLIEGDPVTLVRLGTLDYRAAFLVAGVVVAVALMRRNNPLAFLAAIFVVTAFAWVLGYAAAPERILGPPDFSSVFLELDILGALQLALVPAIVSIMFTDLFDSLSTFIGVAKAAGLTEPDGRPINLRRGLIVDSCATLGAGLAGSSPGTAYVESIAGIRMGGTSGMTAVVTALCFLPCFFVAPLAAAVPAYATAPVLVLVGVTMFQTVAEIDFGRIEDSLPAFVTLVLIPLTFSITQGILWGFILHALLYTVAGRARQVPATLWVLAAISVLLLFLESQR
jgi:AGZA family xanthine/uracil permease-like MFS transporter